jgi:hypothetical protein
MQWSALTEGKQKNELAQKEVRFIKTIIIKKGGNYLLSFASISALQKTANFKSTLASREMQCSALTGERQESTCRKTMMTINKRQTGAGSNYSSRLLTASASAIR